MPESALPGVIDMLRNESPIIIYYAAGSGFLRTGDEPIGEGEKETTPFVVTPYKMSLFLPEGSREYVPLDWKY